MTGALDIAHALARVLCAGLAAGLAVGALAWLARALWRLSRDVRVFGAVRPLLRSARWPVVACALVAAIALSSPADARSRLRTRLLAGVRSVVALWIPASEIGTTIAGSRGEAVTTARNSTATYLDGSGALQTASANQPRIEAAGLLIEAQRTQYLLANCTAPATQTVTLAAGAHRAWIEGAGSLALAVDTAVATGLPCTATSASDCSFTISTGGTVVATVDGAVTFAQLENGAARSSKICSTTTPATRLADAISTANPLADQNAWCIAYTVDTRDWTSRGFFGFGSQSSKNSTRMNTASGFVYFAVYDSAGTAKSLSWTHGFAAGASHRLVGCNNNGTLAIISDGSVVASGGTGAGTGLVSSTMGTLSIGDINGGQPWIPLGGHIKDFRVCRSGDWSRCP